MQAGEKVMRAKFQVQSVEKFQYGEKVKASAVCGGSPEDNSFSQATPSGSLELFINNPALIGKVGPGQKFYVDFTLAAD